MFETNLQIKNSKIEKLKKSKIDSNYFQKFNWQKFFKKIEWEIFWGQWKQRLHSYTGILEFKVTDVKVTDDFWNVKMADQGAGVALRLLSATFDPGSGTFELNRCIFLNYICNRFKRSYTSFDRMVQLQTTTAWKSGLIKMTSKWPQNDLEMTSKWPWNDHKMTLKWPQNDLEMTTKWPWNDHKMTLKWPQNYLEMTPMWTYWLELKRQKTYMTSNDLMTRNQSIYEKQ